MISFLNRAFCVWMLMMLAESIHGVLRSILLVPMIGDLPARQIGVAIGSLIIVALAFVFSNWLKVRSTKGQIIVGFFWVTMTLLFEVLLGRLVLGLSWNRITEDYDLSRGGFMIFGLLLMALSPTIGEKLHLLID